MLSLQERWLIAAILALLLFGGVVQWCRQHAMEKDIPKVQLPGLDAKPGADPKPWDGAR